MEVASVGLRVTWCDMVHRECRPSCETKENVGSTQKYCCIFTPYYLCACLYPTEANSLLWNTEIWRGEHCDVSMGGHAEAWGQNTCRLLEEAAAGQPDWLRPPHRRLLRTVSPGSRGRVVQRGLRLGQGDRAVQRLQHTIQQLNIDFSSLHCHVLYSCIFRKRIMMEMLDIFSSLSVPYLISQGSLLNLYRWRVRQLINKLGIIQVLRHHF